MGNENGVDIVERFADRCQAFAQFAHAEAGVYQDARIFGGQECCVSRTAAGQHAKFDDKLPSTLQNTPIHCKTEWVENVPVRERAVP